jgi:predicted phosphate transport protein (TIGR00153 family)
MPQPAGPGAAAAVPGATASYRAGSVGFRLLPTDRVFFELFDQAAANVVACARRLRDLLNGDDVALEDFVVLERHGDELTRKLLQRLNTSFVTPFDREDIHELTEELDDVVDDVLEVVHKLRLGDGDPTAVPELKEQADLLVRMTEEAAELVARLESMKGVTPHNDNLDHLESAGDAVFRQALGRLFSGELDAIAVLRWKDVVEAMEAALNTLEDVSDVVESIVLKHA